MRAKLYAGKAEALAAAQRAGLLDDTIDPAHLVFLVIALSSYWSAAPQIARMPCGSDAQDSTEAARRHGPRRAADRRTVNDTHHLTRAARYRHVFRAARRAW